MSAFSKLTGGLHWVIEVMNYCSEGGRSVYLLVLLKIYLYFCDMGLGMQKGSVGIRRPEMSMVNDGLFLSPHCILEQSCHVNGYLFRLIFLLPKQFHFLVISHTSSCH